ncbi:MAG: hypothetical protein ACRD0K_06230 [Egibacteraceae bacterium]
MALEPWVRDQMRQITAGLEVRDRAKAETTINDKFREKPVPVDDLGLEIRRYTVTLDLDEAARHYVDRLIEDERKKALEKLEREMDQERADFYEKAMANGRYATAALRLARRPDDFPAVAQTLQKEEAAVIDRFIEIYKATVNASALEEDQIDRTLKALQREFGRMQGNSADMALGSLSLEAGTPPSEPDGGGGEDDEER